VRTPAAAAAAAAAAAPATHRQHQQSSSSSTTRAQTVSHTTHLRTELSQPPNNDRSRGLSRGYARHRVCRPCVDIVLPLHPVETDDLHHLPCGWQQGTNFPSFSEFSSETKRFELPRQARDQYKRKDQNKSGQRGGEAVVVFSFVPHRGPVARRSGRARAALDHATSPSGPDAPLHAVATLPLPCATLRLQADHSGRCRRHHRHRCRQRRQGPRRTVVEVRGVAAGGAAAVRDQQARRTRHPSGTLGAARCSVTRTGAPCGPGAPRRSR
jgi:hypothetical protein